MEYSPVEEQETLSSIGPGEATTEVPKCGCRIVAPVKKLKVGVYFGPTDLTLLATERQTQANWNYRKQPQH